MSKILLSIGKLSFTCFLKIFRLQNYKRSRWDIHWSAFSLHQRRTIDPCHAIGSPAFSCSHKQFEDLAQIWDKCRFCRCKKFSLHQLKTKFANLKDDLGLEGPTSGTSPHCTSLITGWSTAHRKRQPASWIGHLYLAIPRPFSNQNSPKLLKMSIILFCVWKLSFTCFSETFPLQNYKPSRWDVDWSAFSLHQSRALDPCHAIGRPTCLCFRK